MKKMSLRERIDNCYLVKKIPYEEYVYYNSIDEAVNYWVNNYAENLEENIFSSFIYKNDNGYYLSETYLSLPATNNDLSTSKNGFQMGMLRNTSRRLSVKKYGKIEAYIHTVLTSDKFSGYQTIEDLEYVKNSNLKGKKIFVVNNNPDFMISQQVYFKENIIVNTITQGEGRTVENNLDKLNKWDKIADFLKLAPKGSDILLKCGDLKFFIYRYDKHHNDGIFKTQIVLKTGPISDEHIVFNDIDEMMDKYFYKNESLRSIIEKSDFVSIGKIIDN